MARSGRNGCARGRGSVPPRRVSERSRSLYGLECPDPEAFLGAAGGNGSVPAVDARDLERDRFDRGGGAERRQTQTAHREDRARLIADDITKDCLENNKLRMAHTAHGQRCTAGVYNGVYT